METIRGRVSRELDVFALAERLADYESILLDLGTGDGRFVRNMAERQPGWFVVGIDTCRENLHEHSRAKSPNMLFIVASAQHLPLELHGLISHITINFPWGSLLESLLTADPALLDGLRAVSRHTASLDIRLNGGALAEMGTALEAGTVRISDNLRRFGWQVDSFALMSRSALQAFPSTWARRLAVGRDPRTIALRGWTAIEAQPQAPRSAPNGD